MTPMSAPLIQLGELLLEWHAGAAVLDMEAFRRWALASLGSRVRFDGAVWGVTAESGGAYFHRADPASVQGTAGMRLLAAATAGRPGRVVRLDGAAGAAAMEDASEATDAATDAERAAAHAADADHARLHGIGSLLGIRSADPQSAASQFMLLWRADAADAFDDEAAALFELLAAHMMLSFSTCRKLQLVSAGERGATGPVRASALVDRAGTIHESDARFVRTLRREWPDWVGRRLPDALVNHKARKVASRWQFVGRQIVADFMPVNDLFLVTARPRLPADALTAREWDIARRYASGSEYKEVAEALQVSPATVRSHLRRVFMKLNVRNKAQLSTSLG